MLQTLLLDSLIDGFRGSIVDTPSTLKLYRYAPGSIGPSVTSHTPFSPLVSAAACWLPGMSLPVSFTASAFGARIRKVTCRSLCTSGETTTGPCGPRPGCATAQKPSANTLQVNFFIQSLPHPSPLYQAAQAESIGVNSTETG